MAHFLVDYSPTIHPRYLCASMCSFVGWITNFIKQRHHAAASCAYSYARLTFVRRMPPQIRSRLQIRQNKHKMNTTMRGYIKEYTPFVGRGSDVLAVTPWSSRNSRALRICDREVLLRYTSCTYALFFTFVHYCMHYLHLICHYSTYSSRISRYLMYSGCIRALYTVLIHNVLTQVPSPEGSDDRARVCGAEKTHGCVRRRSALASRTALFVL
jgi:hypothetical protein